MDALPINMVTEIFLRLPAKVLIRFKRVCKLWNEIINDPYFIRLHVDRSIATKTNYHFIVKTPLLHLADLDTFCNPVELNYPYKSPIFGGVKIFGSCRGLLLLWRLDYDLTLILYNPTNQTHKILPFLSRLDQFSGLLGKVYFGFGYDSNSEDYKCVRICQLLFKKTGFFESEVMVYSLKADSWRRAPNIPYYFQNKRTCSIAINDNIHWIGENGYRSLVPVVVFCLRDETFHSLALPEMADIPSSTAIEVGVLGGMLCLMADYLNHIDVWIMKEYGVVESWMLAVRITKHWYREYLERPICISFDRDKLFVKTSFQRVASINRESKWLDVKVADFEQCMDAHLCVGNLLKLEGAPDVQAQKREQQPAKKKAKRRRMN